MCDHRCVGRARAVSRARRGGTRRNQRGGCREPSALAHEGESKSHWRSGLPACALGTHLRASSCHGGSCAGRQSGTRSRVMKSPYDVVILGLSVTSSWGNGHATTYRSLIRGLAAHGHRVLFLEREAPWYADNR